MEKRIIERILELSGVSKTVELEKVLLELIDIKIKSDQIP